MVIYEVNVEVAPEIFERYQYWLGDHIREILKIRGFRHAEVWRDVAGAADGWTAISIHYHCDRIENLENYLRDHAPRLREDATKQFADRFRSRRRILTSGEKFTL